MATPKILNLTILNACEYINATSLNASYQRAECWGIKDKSYYIESLLRSQAPSPIILSIGAALQPEDIKYNCVDGKQRLISIIGFLNGEFSTICDNTEVFYDDIVERFNTVNVSLYLYPDGNNDREMFLRINSGKILTTCEKMNNPSAELVREIERKYSDRLKIIASKSSITPLLFALLRLYCPNSENIPTAGAGFGKNIENLLQFADPRLTRKKLETTLKFKLRTGLILTAFLVADAKPITMDAMSAINVEYTKKKINITTSRLTILNEYEIRKIADDLKGRN